MLSGLIAALVVSVVCVIALWVIRRFFGAARLKELNDVSGFYLTIVGTVYAVILAFMVFAVWTDFQAAQAIVEKEANVMVSTARLSYGFPPAAQRTIIDSLLGYGRAAIDDEWPAMREFKESGALRMHLDALWVVALRAEPATVRDAAFLEQTVNQLIALREARRGRLIKSKADLPRLLWNLLIFGGVVTLAGALLIGGNNFALHAIQTALLASTLTFVLWSLEQLNRPFQGAVIVGPDAIIEAVRVIERIDATDGGLDSGAEADDNAEMPGQPPSDP